MSLGKQAKVLTKSQVEMVSNFLRSRRHGLRDQTIFLLSIRAGLRAKEIASLRWSMITDADGNIGEFIHLTDVASKGRSGRQVPLNRHLRENLIEMLKIHHQIGNEFCMKGHVIISERSDHTSAQAIVNMFKRWYGELGLNGCSSHSGRRTFITNAARKISTVGGSLRDVQMLAGHSSLAVTQRYIEGDSDAQRKIVDII